MSWQVGSEKLKTQPSQQPGPSLSHNDRLKGVERSAHSNLDWWEDPSENCILIPSSKRKKKKQVFSEIKVLFKLKCQPSTLPVLPLEFFCSHIFRFYIFLSSEGIIKRLKHVYTVIHSLGMLEMFICNPFVFSKKEIACLGESTSERYSAKMNMSATVFQSLRLSSEIFFLSSEMIEKNVLTNAFSHKGTLQKLLSGFKGFWAGWFSVKGGRGCPPIRLRKILLKSSFFWSKNSIFCLFSCIFSPFWTIIWSFWPIFNLI